MLMGKVTEKKRETGTKVKSLKFLTRRNSIKMEIFRTKLRVFEIQLYPFSKCVSKYVHGMKNFTGCCSLTSTGAMKIVCFNQTVGNIHFARTLCYGRPFLVRGK